MKLEPFQGITLSSRRPLPEESVGPRRVFHILVRSAGLQRYLHFIFSLLLYYLNIHSHGSISLRLEDLHEG